MKVFVWCASCAEFHEMRRVENPYMGDAKVYSDECTSCLVVVDEKEASG